MLREPAAEKFRRVRCGNEAFKARVLAAKGGEEFLRAAGWKDATVDFERHLVLSDAAFNDECVRAGSWALRALRCACFHAARC